MRKNTLFVLTFLFTTLLFPGFAQQEKLVNPILPGFNPDPCIVRSPTGYYIVTSTFEWFPGIPIYHSNDLVNWEQLGHVLTNREQLDLTGTGNANGVFAPSIAYNNGLYYVCYTVVQEGLKWSMKGYPNYIVTATDPAGPWSEPHFVNRLGFDPFLFIDDDNRAYYLIRIFDHREGESSSPGIGMYEIDLATFKPLSNLKFIYSGWGKQSAEGPKMIKHEGYYYLFTAEGGTGYLHSETVARSKTVDGPYERAPKLFYTCKDEPEHPIQKSGHGTVVSTPQGEWFTTHLGSRPLSEQKRSPLGRESFLQKMDWDEEGWPYLTEGLPQMEIDLPKSEQPIVVKPRPIEEIDHFDGEALDIKYQFLRQPPSPDWLSLNKVKGYLAIAGGNALGGYNDQHLLTQRISSTTQTFETELLFTPTNFRHSAGLTAIYNTNHFYSIGLTYHDSLGTCLEIIEADKEYKERLKERFPVNSDLPIYLKMEIDGADLQFYYAATKDHWVAVGPTLDFSKISDEYAGGYTGAMAGLFVQDLLFGTNWGYFNYFKKSTKP